MSSIEDIIKVNFKTSRFKVVVNLRYTSNWISGIQNEQMMKFGLSMAQFNILRILRGAKEPLAVNIVKQRMIEKSPNTTRLMDKLIEKKLIARKRCKDDRRVVFVEITEAGLALLGRIDEEFEEATLLPSNLTEKEAEQLSNLLDKMRTGYE